MPQNNDVPLLDEPHQEHQTRCPFRHTLLPGKIVGELSWHDLPCLHEKCSLWCNQSLLCSIKFTAIALHNIGLHLEQTPPILHTINENLCAIVHNLGRLG